MYNKFVDKYIDNRKQLEGFIKKLELEKERKEVLEVFLDTFNDKYCLDKCEVVIDKYETIIVLIEGAYKEGYGNAKHNHCLKLAQYGKELDPNSEDCFCYFVVNEDEYNKIANWEKIKMNQQDFEVFWYNLKMIIEKKLTEKIKIVDQLTKDIDYLSNLLDQIFICFKDLEKSSKKKGNK